MSEQSSVCLFITSEKHAICYVSKQPLAFPIGNGIYLEKRLLESSAYILQRCTSKTLITCPTLPVSLHMTYEQSQDSKSSLRGHLYV